MRLRRQIDRRARPTLVTLEQRLLHQPVTQPGAARPLGDHHPTDHHLAFHTLRIEQAQIAHQPRLVTRQQVTGVTDQVLAIGFQVGAVLLDHEHLGAQRQQFIEGGGVEFAVVQAVPGKR